MNKKQYFILCLFAIMFNTLASAQTPSTVKGDNWQMHLNPSGTLDSLTFANSGFTALFNQKGKGGEIGPKWYVVMDGKEVALPAPKLKNGKWSTGYDFIDFHLEYVNDNGKPCIIATIENNRPTRFQPTTAGIRLGVNTYMDHYPDWETKLFPTLMRGEKTHFWGYFMSPLGKILAIASPDAIASWSHDYSKSWGEPPYYYWGHRVTSVNLDFINALPLPQRHPQNLYELKPNETKTFKIYLEEVDKLENLYPTITQLTQAPVIDLPQTSFQQGESVTFEIVGGQPASVSITNPNGEIAEANVQSGKVAFDGTDSEGLYTITTKVGEKTAEATFYVRKPYEWYMKNAMEAVNTFPQRAAMTHCESWYGFYTTFAGGKHFPNEASIKEADKAFQEIYPIVFNPEGHHPRQHTFRIQNVSTWIGILVDRYQLYGEEKDLKDAVEFSKYLMKAQGESGAFYARYDLVPGVSANHDDKAVHYTSVIYIAKSMMELLDELDGKKEYKSDYKAIYASVEKAMDELALNMTNIQTEGELTFEDGMISCSSLQLGQFALMQTDEKKRAKYQKAALEFLTQHDCLEQLMIPDARMRSGTLRFWEAQYDVLMANNFLNSPHGWSSWTTYANYYAYLLTGEEKYLLRTFNGLDAAMQSIDLATGKLHWAFMVNPYVKVTQMNRKLEGATTKYVPGMHYNAYDYSHDEFVMGEEYVDMVSDWFYGNSNDNDVHEHFKALEEVALGKAYVMEREDSSLLGFNCKVSKTDEGIEVEPSEELVKSIHFNVKGTIRAKVVLDASSQEIELEKGMQWVEIEK